MPLTIPRYIRKAKIQDVLLRYKWDDWNVQSFFELESDTFHKRMSGVSYRANIAFTIACGEWVVQRFDLVSDDPVPLDHMEASWAGMIDPLYAVWWEPPDEFWLGPIRGVLQLAIIFTLEAKAAANDYTDPALSAYHAWNIAEHIMTNPQPLTDWRERVVDRLERLYPFNEDDPMGDVVPKEVLDPDFDFQSEMAEQLVQAYLISLDPGTNRFLRTPKQMLEFGFKGTPYRFDIKEDRIARNDY